ncbi:MAG TPA: benzoate-CoA ligase family protein [Pyrinomonadaceae bacterium]|nr:benzoate-CoA ligase family protein [Pyrinomonadaceae bacterium]
MNLVEYIFQAPAKLGRWSESAILFEDERISYQHLLHQIRKFVSVLRVLGVREGERVAIAARDCPGFVVSFLGTIAAGAVSVPVSTMATGAELEYVLNHCVAKAIVLTSDQLDKFQSVSGNLAELRHVLLIGGSSGGALQIDEEIARANESELVEVADDTLAFILYTSGSTGRPKGAMHIHRNLPYTVETFCKSVLKVRPHDRLFSSSRLFFAYGLGNSLSFPLATGATAILCKERPTPAIISEVFRKFQPTIFFGVPAIFRSLIEYASQGNLLETSSIRFCVSAGEKLPERIFHEWRDLTGLYILDGIGSTEMLQMFISNERDYLKPGSSGRVVPGYEAKLVDSDGREITGAGEGNLLVKGGSASKGYWKNPEKTAETMTGEWMRTGDVYRRDEDGFYWFEGRSDDLFKTKGLWVSPIEVEEALLSCAEVSEAAVVSGTDEDGIGIVVAYVVLKSGSLETNEMAEKLRAHVSALLPLYKTPSQFHFIEELPRTATGKIQRYKLRQIS